MINTISLVIIFYLMLQVEPAFILATSYSLVKVNAERQQL